MNQQANEYERSKASLNGRRPAQRSRYESIKPPVVLVVSRDASLRDVVTSSSEPPWSVETRDSLESGLQFAEHENVRLIVLDDELIPSGERGRCLARINRLPSEPPMLYVAANHSVEVERSARTIKALYYTSKPVETHRLRQVLQTWMRHLQERSNRAPFSG
jgi:DNA-binding response OmpR family regulator